MDFCEAGIDLYILNNFLDVIEFQAIFAVRISFLQNRNEVLPVQCTRKEIQHIRLNTLVSDPFKKMLGVS